MTADTLIMPGTRTFTEFPEAASFERMPCPSCGKEAMIVPFIGRRFGACPFCDDCWEVTELP